MAKQAKVKADLEVVRVTRELEIVLDKTEREQLYEDATEAQARLDANQAELNKAKALFDEEKQRLQPEINKDQDLIARNHREAKAGKTKRLVECDEVKNYELKKFQYFYPNQKKGTVHQERDFDAMDHQKRMFQEKAEAIPESGMDFEEGRDPVPMSADRAEPSFAEEQ